MIQINISEEEKILKFARAAAKSFKENPQYSTFSEKHPEAGCLFAVRWGISDDCVLVFRLDEDFEPRNYVQLIEKDEKG